MELYKSLGYDQPPYLGMYPGFLLGMVIHIESKVCGLVYISFKQENVLWLLVNVNQKCCWLYILSLTVNPLDIIVKGVMIVTLIRKYGSIITNIASVCL